MASKLTPYNLRNYITSTIASKYESMEVIIKDGHPFIFMLTHQERHNYPTIRVTILYSTDTFSVDKDGLRFFKIEITSLDAKYKLSPTANKILTERIKRAIKGIQECQSSYAKNATPGIMMP